MARKKAVESSAAEKRKKTIEKRVKKQKKEIIELLRKVPINSTVATRAGVSTTTFYRWCEEDSDFKNACDEARLLGVNVINDLAESKVIKKVQEDDSGMIKFWLRFNHINYSTNPALFQKRRSVIVHKISKERAKQITKALKSWLGVFPIQKNDDKSNDKD